MSLVDEVKRLLSLVAESTCAEFVGITLSNIFYDRFKIGEHLVESPSKLIEIAQTNSALSRRSFVILDTWSFLNALNQVLMLRVRGSIAIAVIDILDIRGICRHLGLPLLEPWSDEKIRASIEESLEYSEAFEVPYVVRITPDTLINAKLRGERASACIEREYTFHRFWSGRELWNVYNRIYYREIPRLVLRRAEEKVEIVGDGGKYCIIEPSLINRRDLDIRGLKVVLSLYQNPYPCGYLRSLLKTDVIDVVIESSEYLCSIVSRELSVLSCQIRSDVVAERSRLVAALGREHYLRSEDFCTKLVKSCIVRMLRYDELGKHVVVMSPDLTRLSDYSGKTIPSYETKFVTYVPERISELADYTSLNLLSAVRVMSDVMRDVLIIGMTSCRSIADEMTLSDLHALRDLSSRANVKLIITCDDETTRRLVYILACMHIRAKMVRVDDVRNACQVIRDEIRDPSASIIIVQAKPPSVKKVWIDQEACDRCLDCLICQCDAIKEVKTGLSIDEGACSRCGICVALCLRGSIRYLA